jgi:hypothetical protein
MNRILITNLFYSWIALFLATNAFMYFLSSEIYLPESWFIGQFLVILFFFIGVPFVYNNTIYLDQKSFIKRIIQINAVIKVLVLLYSYYFFKDSFGIGIMGHKDAFWYYKTGVQISQNISNFFIITKNIPLSDIGAIIYYTIIYYVFGDFIFVAGLVNLFFSISSVVFFYKIILIISTENVAKLSSIILSFTPILNYFVVIHLKEIFFVWLILVATYLLLDAFENKKFNFYRTSTYISIGIALFFFRTVVGLVFFTSLSSYLLFFPNIKLQIIYKILTSILLALALAFFIFNSTLAEETEKYYSKSDQSENLLTRGIEQGRGAGSVVKYLTGSNTQVFLALIGPFPTLIRYKMERESVINLYAQIADAFIKSFLFFFFIFSLINLKILKSNIFISSFLIANLLVIAIGGVALLYRMFLPILPFYIYFSVLGMQNLNKKKTYFFILYTFLILMLYIYFNYTKIIDLQL